MQTISYGAAKQLGETEERPESDSVDSADVVIVGGGSAGAVLTARLSEDTSRTVLVADSQHDWGYTSRGNHQRQKVPAPRGKVLGGGSSVNARVAIRPRPSDLAKWASQGTEGWSYEEVLPTFRGRRQRRLQAGLLLNVTNRGRQTRPRPVGRGSQSGSHHRAT
jgi:choline dehydrogenase-like flavoprotein